MNRSLFFGLSRHHIAGILLLLATVVGLSMIPQGGFSANAVVVIDGGGGGGSWEVADIQIPEITPPSGAD
ncbi:MAG: hypothetical protein AAB923_01685, partial [Patescibacteria group bacterium]